MTKPQRARCCWRRFYKAVLLLHCDTAGERFVVAGVRVLRVGESEATALWPLLDTFLAAVGSDVMKVLLVDRGFINGAQNRPAEAGPRHRLGHSHPQRYEPPGRRPGIDEAADDLGGIRADASSTTAGSNPSVA